MTAFDYAVLSIIAVSLLLGVWRGVIGEMLALAAWVVAFIIARAFGADVANWLAPNVVEPSLRLVLAYAFVVVAVLVMFAILRIVLKLLMKAVGLGLLDRMLGGVFGVLRGGLIVMIAVLVAGMTPLPKMDWWRAAQLAPPLETAALAARPWLPTDVASRIRYR